MIQKHQSGGLAVKAQCHHLVRVCLVHLAVPTHYHDLDIPFNLETIVSAFKNNYLLVCTIRYIHK